MLRGITEIFIKLMKQYMPDPFLFAVILTFIAYLGSFFVTDKGALELLTFWYKGLWMILPFAMQMIMVLVAGYALAEAPLVKRFLNGIALFPKNQSQAIITVVLVSAFASILNWGFGLVTGAILARRVGARVKNADYGFLVAGAYSGFMIWESGLSSSIALISATKNAEMNHVEKITGSILPLSETIFAPINVLPTLLVLFLLPVIFIMMQPKPEMVRSYIGTNADDDELDDEKNKEYSHTFAETIERSSLISILFVVLIFGGLFAHLYLVSASFDLNCMILLLVGFGVMFHKTPIRYVQAINRAARTVGPLIIQYPLYGGIMGLLEHSGTAAMLSEWFVEISTSKTLPFWSYIASNLLNFFVPSGGGHWAVQGGIVVKAADSIGASQVATAMGVAFGDQVANMVQPFWALPLLAVAGLSIRDIMGYCVIVFFTGFTVYGLALLAFS